MIKKKNMRHVGFDTICTIRIDTTSFFIGAYYSFIFCTELHVCEKTVISTVVYCFLDKITQT